MSVFPLYDNLIKDLPKKDLTIKQKNHFIKIIGVIDDNNTKELIYVLIQFYFKNNSLDSTIDSTLEYELPYKGKKTVCENKNNLYDITWDLLDLPIPLRQIIYKFISLHIKQMEEQNI